MLCDRKLPQEEARVQRSLSALFGRRVCSQTVHCEWGVGHRSVRMRGRALNPKFDMAT